MNDKVVDINVNEPFFSIDSLGGSHHVIPVSFFKDVRTGNVSLKELDCFDSIVPTIINEWMISKGIKP